MFYLGTRTPRFTTGEGITSLLDPEKPRDWNVCEVVAWGNVGIHLLNGQVVLVAQQSALQGGAAAKFVGPRKDPAPVRGGGTILPQVEVRRDFRNPAGSARACADGGTAEAVSFRYAAAETLYGWLGAMRPWQVHLAAGLATGEGGMGLWWFAQRLFTNFVLRGEWMQEGPDSDSGVFVRFPNPGDDPWVAVRQGHEFEIGERQPAKPKDGTGSFYPFHGPATVPVKPWGEWNGYELICIGPNYSLRINGELVNTWTDDQKRPLSGYVGLQNYPYKQAVRHRHVRIKPLL